MEKGAVSVRRGSRRGEITWMPEKARGKEVGRVLVDGRSGEWPSEIAALRSRS